jgi:tetratricopeptide (TPR) repeat protein
MTTNASEPKPAKKRYRKAVGSRLQKVLFLLFALFAVMGVNSVYLVSITLLEWKTGEIYENYFYQVMFLGHLVLGLLIVSPVIGFGIGHIRNTYNRPNRRAVRAGYALFTASLVLLVSGFLLMRLDVYGVPFEVRDPGVRSVAYWAHVLAPLVVVWLFILHRLAGRKIKWKIGAAWLAVAAGFALVMALLHSQDPKRWNEVGPASGEKYFFPSLARTATGNFIPAETLDFDEYCQQCHADIYKSWNHSVHHFASFNNPAYAFSVRETRRVAQERDGNVQAARFCAGCHDPVPFFSGAFDDDKRLDDPEFDLSQHPTAEAGVTCTACHAITKINSPLGNAAYTIEEPSHYPFAFSESPFLRWVNRQLVKAKPAFHKKTFLKPLHHSNEFCGACHKVHLPEELNAYKWLRGQNHYDDFLLSGVSGHGVQSFYYPDKAKSNCQDCHMLLQASDDFGARERDDSGELKVHDHLFPSANTAIPYLKGMPPEVVQAHQEFNEGVMRVDLFGVRKGGTIEGELVAPLRPELPVLEPGESYLLETVVRTLKMGHQLTQGTADSNELWLDVVVKSGGRVIGRSGGRDKYGEVDPWSHFLNVYMLDRNGNRVDRRNAQDIFVPLYNHQIPPGAADVVHYRLDVPSDVSAPLSVEVALRYRKFDTKYMRYFQGDAFKGNDLPVLTLVTDSLTFPVSGAPAKVEPRADAPEWQRWNDFGIGLLRKAGTSGPAGELRQAEEAFARVEALDRADGPLNLGRVYLREGRLEEAVEALGRAARHDPPAPPWSVLWFSAQVDKQNGFLDEAIQRYESLLAMDTEETRQRGFDFSVDWRVLDDLGVTLYERAKQERGEARKAQRQAFLERARKAFERTLELEPEDLIAHYNLAFLYEELGDSAKAAHHRAKHEEYKPDDNARDVAIAQARAKDPAADHAAEAVVIYDLRRTGAYELIASAQAGQEDAPAVSR